jgi:hypothetical protein
MNDEREKIWKETVVAYSSTVLVCSWKDCEPSVRIAGIPGEIRTENLLNTGIEVTATPTRSVWRSCQSVRPGCLLAMIYNEPINRWVGS